MTKFYLIGLINLITAATAIQAQSYYYLSKKGEVPAHRYQQNELISFYLISEERWVEGPLSDLDEESLIMGSKRYLLSDIAVFKRQEPLSHIFGLGFMSAAGLFTGVALINGATNGDRPLVQPSFLAAMGVSLGLGAILEWISIKKYPTEEGWHLRRINFNELDNG
jgi:hypothetical protein